MRNYSFRATLDGELIVNYCGGMISGPVSPADFMIMKQFADIE